MNLDIPWYFFSVSFSQILSMFMFMQDNEKQEQRIGYKKKGKILEDSFKDKSLALKIPKAFQEQPCINL